MFLGHNGEGSEEVDGVALLIGIRNELGVELLVAAQTDTAGLLIFILKTKKRWNGECAVLALPHTLHEPSLKFS